MSQDATAPANPAKPAEVNLDELEVEIFILCKNTNALNASATFLTRRGWPTTVMSNVTQAIEYISEKKPDFVLISFSHPSPSIPKLPDLITQTFNVDCIGFAENQDSSSQSKLNNSKVRNKIQGTASGPNLQRSIRKILSDKFNPKPEGSSTERNDRTNEDSGSVVTVKGSSATSSSASTMIQSSNRGPSSTDNSQGSKVSGQIGYMPESQSAEARGAAYTPGSGAFTNDATTSFDSTAPALGAVAQGASPNESAGEPKPGVLNNETVSSGKYTMSATKNRRSLKQLAQAGGPMDAPKSAEFAESDSAGSKTRSEIESEKSKLLLDQLKNSLSAEGNDQVTTDDTSERNSAFLSPESGSTESIPHLNLLEKAVSATLNQIGKPLDGEIRALGLLDKVAVFPVASETLGGYLVVGVDQNAGKIEDFFLQILEIQLQKDLIELQVPAKIESGFWVHVPTVAFIDWIAVKAQFQCVVAHEDSEVAVAFFPLDRVVPKAHQDQNSGMVSVAIENIPTEQTLNFKAYIHLQKNNKYFLYLRNGRKFQPEQKTRLIGHKVNDIYMKDIDMQNLRMFFAASFLRDSIKSAA